MAMLVDQQQTYKHYCRICKKGFGCGQALGGHMRVHGVNDEPIGGNEGDEWDDKLDSPGGHKRMYYALRTNPNRLKSCRVCENCGKEFLSWKSFLEHGKCSLEDDGDDWMLSSPKSDGDDDPVGQCSGWSKGKRSRRAKGAVGNSNSNCPSSEEEDLANCLVMLSAARVEPISIIEAEESCASASKDEDRRNFVDRREKSKAVVSASTRGLFECKACKKVFSSHQALGGHRASHKKVKGCFAAKNDDLDEAPLEEEVVTQAMAIVPFDQAPLAIMPPVKKKSKVHECSICHRVFTSGQALGGHKRCHWITSNSPDPGSIVKLHHHIQDQDQAHHHHHQPQQEQQQQQQLQLRPMFEKFEPLDLNLPARDVETTLGGDDVPAAICLEAWIDHSNNNNNNNNITISNNNKIDTSNLNVDDDGDSRIKLAKLSELKDMNMGGESSPWLQVGIGSCANESSEP